MKTETAFWDTSAIVPLCVYQGTTSAARRANENFPVRMIWWGTVVEMCSSFARLKKAGELKESDFEIAAAKWLGIANRSRVIPPVTTLLAIATKLPDEYGIRALDAFQLATALVWCRERPRNRPFICADKRLGDAAVDAGFGAVLIA
ncbi:MAG: type II toxin-antitoxin system VapC family toxin [Pyrinomonadaceae bacterium]